MAFNVGYTTVPTAANDAGINAGFTVCNGSTSAYVMPQAGVLQSVTVNSFAAQTVTLGVYSDNAGAPGTLLATTAQTSISTGLVTLNTTTNPTITSGSPIWVCVLFPLAVGSLKYDVVTNARKFDSGGDSVLPATWPGTLGNDTEQYQLYATFNPTGSGAAASGRAITAVTSKTKPSGKVPLFG